MPRLRDRQRQIPGGFKFSLEPLAYVAPAYASFDVILDGAMQVIQANPEKAAKYHWPLTRHQLADWVDEHNARLCASYGWRDYVMEADEPRGTKEYRPDLWPLWARTMHGLRTPEDKGVGDTVERIIGVSGPNAPAKLREFYQKSFGRICGCDGTKTQWNAQFPYSNV